MKLVSFVILFLMSGAAHALPLVAKEYDNLRFDDVLVYERTPTALKFSRCPVDRSECKELGGISLDALKDLRHLVAEIPEGQFRVLQRKMETAKPQSAWKSARDIVGTYLGLALAWGSFSPKVGNTMAMFMREAIWKTAGWHVKLDRLRLLNQVLLAAPLLINIVYGTYSGIAGLIRDSRHQQEISKEFVMDTLDQLIAKLTHTMNTTKVGQLGSIALPLWLWEQVEEWEDAAATDAPAADVASPRS